MKKLTTLLAFLLIAIFASAQNVVFTNNGVTIEDGATITIDAFVINKEMPGWESVVAHTNGNDGDKKPLPNQICIENKTSSEQDINAIATTISNENVNLSWCMGFGSGIGQCQNFTESLTKKGTMEIGEIDELELDGSFTLGKAGSAKIKVEIKSGLATLHTIYVVMNYNPGGSGLHASKDNASLKVVDNNLIYKFATIGHYSIEVYDTAGNHVKSSQLDQEGTLSLETLSKGIYICEIRENGQRIATNKCIIK